MQTKFLIHTSTERLDRLRSVKEQTGSTSLAETIRRMLDHCLTPSGLNEAFPAHSGRIHLGERHR